MKQECTLSFIWLTWFGLPILAIVFGLYQGLFAGIFILLVGIISQIIYLRRFPKISKLLGYGTVDDVQPENLDLVRNIPLVTLYTANVCPFCPIVRQRLKEMQQTMNFELKEIDITFKPQIIREKGLRSVPVVEVDGRLLHGNATTLELAQFLVGDLS